MVWVLHQLQRGAWHLQASYGLHFQKRRGRLLFVHCSSLMSLTWTLLCRPSSAPHKRSHVPWGWYHCWEPCLLTCNPTRLPPVSTPQPSPPPLAYLPAGLSFRLLQSRHQDLPNVFLLLSPERRLLCPSPSQLPSPSSILYLSWLEFLPSSEKHAWILNLSSLPPCLFFSFTAKILKVIHTYPSFPHLLWTTQPTLTWSPSPLHLCSG